MSPSPPRSSAPASPSPSTPRSGVGGTVPWPGPAPTEVDDGSLVTSVSAPSTGTVVLRAIGEIDMLTAPGWRRSLLAAARVTGSGAGTVDDPRLVVDLSPVTFLGASGLAVLVELADRTAEHGVDLVVVAGRRHVVCRPLEITGLHRRLRVVDDVEGSVDGADRRDDAAVPRPRDGR